jgi:hypothetical protein
LSDPAAAAGRDNASPWGGSAGAGGGDQLASALGRDDLSRGSGQGASGDQRQSAFSDDHNTAGDDMFGSDPNEDAYVDDGGFDSGGFDNE